ncbi:hypothetical protein ASD37_25390 [Mycobacterium sp. Root135]|nr:hypothetical protein ASD37_25390 [Mycobacterium sp. Root135]
MLTLDEYLREHDGVITLGHARDAGMSNDAVNRLVRAGRWRRCTPGVYFAEDHRFTDAARVRAGVWSYGVEATASGLTAAWWLDMTKFAPEIVEVTVARDRRLAHRAGTRLRRRDLVSVDVVERRGLRVTAPDLTVVEAASRLGGGARVLDSALQRRQSELPRLWRAHLRNKGRHGAPRSRQLLRAASNGARSEAERLFARLLDAAGITGWKANHGVAGYDVDFAFIGPKVAVEIDGLAFHSDADDFHRDRKRQNAIALAGWQVLRFTWLDLTEYPERVIAQVRRAIRGV